MHTDISFDPAKILRNEIERRLAFSLVLDWEWSTAWNKEDLRTDYGERRFQLLGHIRGRLHAMVFTPRDDKAHVISLRKANALEVKHYEQTQNSTAHTRH